MIILKDYMNMSQIIEINNNSYEIVSGEITLRNGVGTLVNDDLVALYTEADKYYFYYKNYAYEFTAENILVENKALNEATREFSVKIGGDEICTIEYESYVNPLALSFEEDEDEFDFLGYLTKILASTEEINTFFRGISNLNKFYSQQK